MNVDEARTDPEAPTTMILAARVLRGFPIKSNSVESQIIAPPCWYEARSCKHGNYRWEAQKLHSLH